MAAAAATSVARWGVVTDRHHALPPTERDPTMIDKHDEPAHVDSPTGEDYRGVSRRLLMAMLGGGLVGTALSGTASAKHRPQHPPVIDPYYGYAAPSDQEVPGKLQPDHEVEVHVDESAIFSSDPTDLPFHFEPMGLQISAGDIVRFTFESPEHTITAFHREMGREHRVPDDALPFSSPVISEGGFWLYQFDSPGTYDVFCAPHEPFGMVMRLVVGDPDSEGYDGSFEATGRPPGSRAELTLLGIPDFPFPTPNAVLQTEALSPSNITASGSVSPGEVETDLDDLPIVTTLLPLETGGSGTDAEFDVQWEVQDPGGNLDELALLLIDTGSTPPGPEGPPKTESVSNSTDDGSTTLVASGDEGSGNTYVVQATVRDSDGNDSSVAVPTMEDPSV